MFHAPTTGPKRAHQPRFIFCYQVFFVYVPSSATSLLISKSTNKTNSDFFLEKVKTNPELILNILEKIDFSKFSRLSKNLGIEDRHRFFSNMHRKEPFATLRSGGLSCKVHTASTSSNHLLPISWTLIFILIWLRVAHWGPNFIHRETSHRPGFSMDCQSSAWRQSGPRIPDLI